MAQVYNISTTIAPSLLANATTLAVNTSTKDPGSMLVTEVAKWINGFIIILGFVTNSLTVAILAQYRIGSRTTRITLLFLAFADLIVMVVELFVHYIPYYWRWFPIFYTDAGCAVAIFVQVSVITTSAWYLVLMTIERFIVVWFPMKAKIICTPKLVLIACALMPIVSMVCYCYFLLDMGISTDEFGYSKCGPKANLAKDADEAAKFKLKLQMWIVSYFFIPAAIIMTLSSAVVFKLSQADKLQRSLTQSRMKRSMPRQMTRSMSTVSNNPNSIKRATMLVMIASLTFVVLMIPRGISTEISLDASWDYDNVAHEILDTVSYLLQYTNHSINFFIYVLANGNFRKALIKILYCQGHRKKYWQKPRRSIAETDITQVTYVPHRSSASDKKLKSSSLQASHEGDDVLVEASHLVDSLSHDSSSDEASL